MLIRNNLNIIKIQPVRQEKTDILNDRQNLDILIIKVITTSYKQ